MRIGIAITTYNRHNVLDRSLVEWRKFLPPDAELVVVDDGSIPPHNKADYTFSYNAGIASAKNKCIELLLERGCEHLFLADEDTWPTTPDWHKPYINSAIKHLSFTFTKLANGKGNGHKLINSRNGINEFSSPCGCLLYIHRSVIDKIGGFDVDYPQWGYEHADFSRRAYNVGLTPKPYLDVVNSLDMFHSMDYYGEVAGSINGTVKSQAHQVNKMRFETRAKSKEYMPYAHSHNGVILASYLNSVKDPQRGVRWDTSLHGIRKLYQSARALNIPIRIFHDCLSVDPRDKSFVRINPQNEYAPNIYRWMVYDKWLNESDDGKVWDNIFMVDSTDVEVLRNPFVSINPNKLYVGDECNMVVDNKWMQMYEEPHMSNFPDYRAIIEANGSERLLNCGIVGGSRDVVLKHLAYRTQYHIERTRGILHATDMAMFNYILWKHYDVANEVTHGIKVNTRFKHNEYNRISFFKHK